MAQRIYTKPVQIAMFEAARTEFGTWSDAAWSGGKPIQMSTQQFQAKCEVIRISLVKKFQDKAPSTSRSIAMALWFTLEVASSKSQQPQFRVSAYEGGFLRMTDILTLESQRAQTSV